MPKFEVEIPHALPLSEARTRLGRAIAKLERDYGATCTWEGADQLVVARKGLNARVCVEPMRLHVKVELGLLMSPLMGNIRTGITKQLLGLMSDTPSD